MKKNNFWTLILVTSLALGFYQSRANAAVAADEAAKLGNELTPIGANPNANEDGTIPEWTGGITSPPPDYVEGKFPTDPYAADSIIETITASNAEKYKDKLTAGQLEMFKRYPETFKMNIYPTRRSVSLPQRIYDKARHNAENATLAEDGNGVLNYQEAIPFPIPQNGLEAIWNHLLRYRGGSLGFERIQAIVQRTGSFHVINLNEETVFPEFMDGHDPVADKNILAYFVQKVTAPARLTGNVLLVHDTVNQVAQPRHAWVYNAGQRRVRRAPQVAYDGPGTAADGLRTSDNFDQFSGSPDRYEWKLMGKKEVYIPYNSYKLLNTQEPFKEVFDAGHMNPDFIRYELHRVWVVEATLKKGQRHIYARRVLYLDEDSWQSAAVDHYNGRDEFWRYAESYGAHFYFANAPFYASEAVHDLISGRYLVLGIFDRNDSAPRFGFRRDKTQFTPAAIRRAGKR